MKLTNTEVRNLFRAHEKLTTLRFPFKPATRLALARNLSALRSAMTDIVSVTNDLVAKHSDGKDKVDPAVNPEAYRAFCAEVEELNKLDCEVDLKPLTEVELSPIDDIGILEGILPIIE